MRKNNLFLLLALLIIIADISFFTVYQAYISGRNIAKDYVVPALTLIFLWYSLILFAKSQIYFISRLISILIFIISSITFLLYSYYHRFDIHFSRFDIAAIMQTNFFEASEYALTYIINMKKLGIIAMLLLLIIFASELLIHRIKTIYI